MASKNPPVKNAAFTFRIALFAQSDDQIKTTPTIAAGDFKVSVDGGALANPTTLPSESPASSGAVLITLTAAEMNGDEIFIRWLDASGDEWHSGAMVLHTIAAGKQFDDLSTLTAAQVNTEADQALVDYDPPTKAEMDAGFAGISATVFPAGAIEFTYTVTNSVTGNPIDGVEVWFSTDNPATNVIWKGETDSFGIARDVLGNKPRLDAGTYFVFRNLAGFIFNDPDTEIVS